MDISVSRLNNRMALQVPPELPLGLVFVVGHATRLYVPRGEPNMVAFQLLDGDHRLRVRLPRAVAEETLLNEGDRVRVSGNLAFDAHRAQYVLAASDLEVLPRRDPETSLQPILNDARQRAEQMALDHADLPPWVQKLAPSEVRREIEFFSRQEVAEEEAEQSEPKVTVASTALVKWSADAAPPHLQPPNSELVDFLSSAMDSNDEVELTPEMIDRYLGPDDGPQHGPDASSPPVDEIHLPRAEEPATGRDERAYERNVDQPTVVAEDITGNSTLQIALLGLLILLLLASVVVLVMALFGNA